MGGVSPLVAAFALGGAALASAATYPVTGPAAPVQWQGRYRDVPAGAMFDWPGTRVSFTVTGTTTVSMNLSAPGKLLGQIRVYLDGVNGSTIFVDATKTEWPVISNLDAGRQHTITLYNVLEPALWHPQPFLPSPPYDQAAVLSSITVDGTILPPGPPLKRNLVFVGDSITAGFGAGGEAPCPTSPTYQEANDNTYGNMLCGNFSANCSIVAWSGKVSAGRRRQQRRVGEGRLARSGGWGWPREGVGLHRGKRGTVRCGVVPKDGRRWDAGAPWPLPTWCHPHTPPPQWHGMCVPPAQGLYVNSPTAGTEETLPFYYRSAVGVDPYSTDWDFGRFTPDAVVINLGE